MVTPGVLPDLQSGIKKCPNLLGSADLQSAAKEYALPYVGGLYIPGLIGRTFFYGGFQIRRDAWRGCAFDTPFFLRS